MECAFFQVEDATIEYFDGVVKQDNIIIINYDVNASQQPQYLAEYIEGWRRTIWDHGFMNYFKGQKYFKKGDSFMAHEGAAAAVRRVVFRYVQSTYFHETLVSHQEYVFEVLELQLKNVQVFN